MGFETVKDTNDTVKSGSGDEFVDDKEPKQDEDHDDENALLFGPSNDRSTSL